MRISACELALVLILSLSAYGNEFTDKDFAVDVFGQEESEPIYTGFFFHNGKYIPPPYIVERRGLSVFINDILVHIPIPYKYEKREIPSELPEIPKTITKNSEADDVTKFLSKTALYIQHNYEKKFKATGKSLNEITAEYFKKHPCVKDSYPNKDGSIEIELHNGENFAFVRSLPGRKRGRLWSSPQLSDEMRLKRLKKGYVYSYWEKVDMLKRNSLLIGLRTFLPVRGESLPDEIYEFVSILNSNLSKKKKIRKLDKFNFSNEDVLNPLLVKNYQYSKELTERVEALYKEWKNSHSQTEKPQEVRKPDILDTFFEMKNWARMHYPNDTEAKPYDWPCYEEEFGSKKGLTVNSGLIILDGKLILPPYLVSRKGLSIFVNDNVLIVPPVQYPIELPQLPEAQEIDYERIKKNGIRGISDSFFEDCYEGLLLRYPLDEANKKLLEKFRSLGFDRLEMIKVKPPKDKNDLDFVKIYDDKGTFLPESARKFAEELRQLPMGIENELDEIKEAKEAEIIRVFDEHGVFVPEDGGTNFKLFNLSEMRQRLKEKYGEIPSPATYSKEKILAHYDELLGLTEKLLANKCLFIVSKTDWDFPIFSPDKTGHLNAISKLVEILKSGKSAKEKAEEIEKNRIVSSQIALKLIAISNDEFIQKLLANFSK